MVEPGKNGCIISQKPKNSVSKPRRRLSARRLRITEMC